MNIEVTTPLHTRQASPRRPHPLRALWGRMRLSTRFSIAAVVLVLATVGATIWATRAGIEGGVTPARVKWLAQHAERQARELANVLDEGVEVVRSYERDPSLEGFVRSLHAGGVDPVDGVSAEVWRARLAQRFLGDLAVRPEMDLIRLIGAADGGREIVRVDRRGPDGSTRIVPEETLMRKGDRPYFREAIRMQAGEIYFSPIVLSRDRATGRFRTPHRPIVRMAAPVHDASGRLFGLMIVNLDLSQAFASLRPIVGGGEVYVVNRAGQYLAHPKKGRAFGFLFDARDDIGADFPELGARIAFDRAQSVIQGRRAVALQPVETGALAAVIETAPREALVAEASSAFDHVMVALLLTALGGVALAILLARGVARPIERLARIVLGRKDAADAMEQAFPEIRELEAALAKAHEESRAHEDFLRTLAERDWLFAAAVESTPDAVVTLTLDGIVTSWNSGAEWLYGYSAEEMIGRHVKAIAPENACAEGAEFLTLVRAGKQARLRETVHVARSGRRIDVLLTISPLRRPEGAVIGAALVVRDITDQKIAEARFKAVVEAAPNGMIVVEADGAISLANSEAERMFGHGPGELIGRKVDELVPGPARARHASLRVGFSVEPKRRQMVGRELMARRKDGGEFPVEIGLSPMATRRRTSVLAVIVDITERKRADDLLRAKAAELARSNEDLEQFAYVASHDLQEPLRMVASYTQLLAERYDGQLDERGRRYIAYAVDGARRMQTLVRDLLSYSRATSTAPALAPTDMKNLTEDVLAGMEGAVAAASARVEVEEDMPRAMADEKQIRHVLQNLLGNALKFRGEAPLRVRVRARLDMRLAVFSVEDNGIGIDPRHAERVFQMFQRLHERGSYEGSGIGLAIVKKIVERHGGRVWIESAPGEGTTVSFTLQRAPLAA